MGHGPSACQAGARAVLGRARERYWSVPLDGCRRLGASATKNAPAVRPVRSTDVRVTSTNQSQHRLVTPFARQVDPALCLSSGDDQRRKGRWNITCRQHWYLIPELLLVAGRRRNRCDMIDTGYGAGYRAR